MMTGRDFIMNGGDFHDDWSKFIMNGGDFHNGWSRFHLFIPGITHGIAS